MAGRFLDQREPAKPFFAKERPQPLSPARRVAFRRRPPRASRPEAAVTPRRKWRTYPFQVVCGQYSWFGMIKMS